MKTFCVALCAAALVCLTAALPALADTTLFSDLGTGGSVYGNSPSVVQGNAGGTESWITQARMFAVAGSGSFDLTQIDLGVEKGGGAGMFTASLWTDVSSKPGTELGSWNLSTTNNHCCTLATQSGIMGVTLVGGTTYFMLVGPQSSTDSSRVFWEDNTRGSTSLLLGSLNGGATWITESGGLQTNAAFDVLGTPVTAAPVPEPASLLLLGSGLVGLGSRLRRRAR